MNRGEKQQPLLSISISLNTPAPSFRVKQFIRLVRHLEKLFNYYLGQLKSYVLDGSVGVFVRFGPRTDLPGYHKTASGWSMIDTRKFDLDSFLMMDDAARDAFVMEVVEKALISIACQVGADPIPIRETAATIRLQKYEAFLPEPDKSSSHSRVALDGVVCQHVSRAGPCWCVRLTDKSGHILATGWVPETVSNTNPFFNYFARSKWNKNEFCFCRDNGRVIYTVDFSEAIADCAVPFEKQQSASRQKPAKRASDTVTARPADSKQVRRRKQILTQIGEAHRELSEVLGTTRKPRRATPVTEAYCCASMPDRQFSAAEPVAAGQQFFEALLIGDVRSAYGSLAKFQKAKMSSKQFRERVLEFVGIADPQQNEGVTIEQLRPYISVSIEEPEITAEYAEGLPVDFPRDAIVAGLEAGGERISRETLSFFAVCEGRSLRIAVFA